MAHFEKPRINAQEARVVSSDQAFLDKAVEDLTTVVNTLAASLTSKLSASGYDKIRAIVKLDDISVKEQDRKTLIAAAAPAEAAALLPQARSDLAKVVDYTQASKLGLDSTRVQSLLDRMLEEQLKAAVVSKMTESHQEIVKLRTDYRAKLTTEGNKITRDIADRIALDVSTDNNKELRAILRTGKVHLPRTDRDQLMVTGAQKKTDSELAAAVKELENRVPMSYAVALGLDPTEEKKTIEAALKSTLQTAIKNKLNEGYERLCEESRARAETRATAWGWAKLLAPAALLVATGATVAIIGGTSLVFWGPVGGVAMVAAYGVCRFFQNRAEDTHLN